MEHASLQTFVRYHEETSEAQVYLTLGDHTTRSVSGIGASVRMRYVISPIPYVRLVVATHPGTSADPAIGVERDGVVYELLVSTLPTSAFTTSDVLDLYLHHGSFETVLADEDKEQEMDRWYSRTPLGQEFAQILAQWVWNVRLELGQQLSQTEVCTTEFAPAHEAESLSTEESEPVAAPPPILDCEDTS